MRVVIVAESALAAEAVRKGLQYAPTFCVVGYVDGRRPCAEIVAAAAPDLVVINDMDVPRRALERIAEVRHARPDAKIVLLSATMDADLLHEASEAGIDAAVARSVGATGLATLVRQIATGVVFHAFAPAPPAATVARGAEQLTPRELQILRLAAAGAANSRIAGELWVTEQTVKFHLSNIYRKLGVANRTGASHYAHTHGLLGRETKTPELELTTPRAA